MRWSRRAAIDEEARKCLDATARPLSSEAIAALERQARVRRELFSPGQAADAESLRAQGRWREAWALMGLAIGFDPAAPPVRLMPDGQRALQVDIRSLAPDLLTLNFPRTANGRLPIGETVPLAWYDSVDPPGRDRQFWLTACSPASRGEPQCITLQLLSLIGENHEHRWDSAPWLWDARSRTAGEAERWGVEGLPLGLLGLEGREQHLEEFQAALAGSPEDPALRAAVCILLQDEGRLSEALALYDAEQAADMGRVLARGAASLLRPPDVPSWTQAVEDAFRSCAPWLFWPALATEQQRLALWRAAKAGRPRKQARLRLFALPHQPQQSKASLMLVAGAEGHPRLEIEYTASNVRLPEVLWRRPAELDLARFRLRQPPAPAGV